MEHVRRLAEPALRNPAVLFAFTGWNDAGDAASASVRALVERWDATAVAEIDPEPFTDFATIRPHVRINDGRRSIVWPTVGVWSASVPGGDVLLVLGPEPSLRWKLFCAPARRPRRGGSAPAWPSASAPCSPTCPTAARCRSSARPATPS